MLANCVVSEIQHSNRNQVSGKRKLDTHFAFLTVFKMFFFYIQEENGETSAVFVLEDNESTRKMWNYRFKLLYEVIVGKHNLKTTITAENKGTCIL